MQSSPWSPAPRCLSTLLQTATGYLPVSSGGQATSLLSGNPLWRQASSESAQARPGATFGLVQVAPLPPFLPPRSCLLPSFLFSADQPFKQRNAPDTVGLSSRRLHFEEEHIEVKRHPQQPRSLTPVGGTSPLQVSHK